MIKCQNTCIRVHHLLIVIKCFKEYEKINGGHFIFLHKLKQHMKNNTSWTTFCLFRHYHLNVHKNTQWKTRLRKFNTISGKKITCTDMCWFSKVATDQLFQLFRMIVANKCIVCNQLAKCSFYIPKMHVNKDLAYIPRAHWIFSFGH